MHFPRPLASGTLLRRYKRYLADVRLDDGREVVAHCPNPGRMTSCAEPGWPVWLSPADSADLASGKRKLAWTWEVALAGPDRVPILVNTARPNAVVAEAIAAGRVPALTGYAKLTCEVKYGEKSRVDLLLEGGERGGGCYVEVKNVTLLELPGVAAFPDAVTARGARHVAELAAQVAAGDRAALFYLVRSDARVVRPADAVDPAYGEALRAAVARGVEVLAFAAVVRRDGVVLGDEVGVAL